MFGAANVQPLYPETGRIEGLRKILEASGINGCFRSYCWKCFLFPLYSIDKTYFKEFVFGEAVFKMLVLKRSVEAKSAVFSLFSVSVVVDGFLNTIAKMHPSLNCSLPVSLFVTLFFCDIFRGRWMGNRGQT